MSSGFNLCCTMFVWLVLVVNKVVLPFSSKEKRQEL